MDILVSARLSSEESRSSAMSGMVLIAGAGPVGLTAAMALKRLGVEVRIVDRAAARTDKSKALVVWPRTLELLDVQGCVRGFLDAGLEGTGARILADDRELVHLSFATARSPYRFALFLPQSETERLLEEELARLGVAVERRVELRSFADDDGAAGVRATLLHPEGRSEEVHASFLVGCDGAHSTVRHGLGVPFEGATERSDWVLADLGVDGDLAPRELTVCWQPDGILAFFPIVGGRFRVVADVGPVVPEADADADAAPPTVAEIQALLEARGPKGLRAHDPIWLARFRINERKVQDYRKGRVFLAGDAAHVHSPAGGQGMNTGMQDAFNLAWKLALVWHGRARETLLDSYSPERGAIGEQVLRNATRMTHVAIARNPILQQLRNAAAGVLGHVPALRQRLVDQLTELDLNYAHGPLMGGASGRPADGHRAPDVRLASGNAGPPSRLHEVLRGGRFVVLSVGSPALALPDDLEPLAATARADDTQDYADRHRYLIRPDGYVALGTSAADRTSIPAFLRQIAPPRAHG
jgi:2-polyprenyl-6-methoxyphenol hydroxylase-like FAD-dependent oxidoreductase